MPSLASILTHFRLEDSAGKAAYSCRVLGGRLAGRVQPSTLRSIVLSISVIVSIIYFVRR